MLQNIQNKVANINDQCPQCEKKQLLLEKYEKLVTLLQKKLKNFTSTSTAGFFRSGNSQILSMNNDANKFKNKKCQDYTVSRHESLSMTKELLTISKLKSRCILKFGNTNDQNIHSNLKLMKTSPDNFIQTTKIMKSTQYFQVIKKLRNDLQLKCDRVEVLSDQLYTAKNSTMHLRQIVHQLLKCICNKEKYKNFELGKHSEKKEQIIFLLMQFFEFSEQQRNQIFIENSIIKETKNKNNKKNRIQNLRT